MHPRINLGLLRAESRHLLLVDSDNESVVEFQVDVLPELISAVEGLPNFTPRERYISDAPRPHEVGKVERFRFFENPDIAPVGWIMTAVRAVSAEEVA